MLTSKSTIRKIIEDSSIPVSDRHYFKKTTLPLFSPNSLLPELDDVRQGALGVCYMDAVFQSMVHKRPELIRQLFVEETESTVTIRLFHNRKNPRYYVLEKSIYCDDRGSPANRHRYLWVHLLEKAITMHYRHHKGDNYCDMATGGYARHAFIHCFGEAKNHNPIAFIQQLSTHFLSHDREGNRDFCQEFFPNSMASHVMALYFKQQQDSFAEQKIKLSFSESKSLSQHLKADLFAEEIPDDWSEPLKQTVAVYREFIKQVCLGFLKGICGTEERVVTAGSQTEEHEYSLYALQERDDEVFLLLRNPWCQSDANKNVHLGMTVFSMAQFFKEFDSLTYCDLRQARYDEASPATLTLTAQEELSLQYANNCFSCLPVWSHLAAATQKQVAGMFARVLMRHDQLKNLNSEQSISLQGALRTWIKPYIYKRDWGNSVWANLSYLISSTSTSAAYDIKIGSQHGSKQLSEAYIEEKLETFVHSELMSINTPIPR